MEKKTTRRGFVEKDIYEFGESSKEKLVKARDDIIYLINHGYNKKSATTYVGDHYLLSARQRLAMMRALATNEAISLRRAKEVSDLEGKTVHIAGFNTIITLEVALSGTQLIKCLDGTIRDLAGIRGTYRIIDKTPIAIRYIGEALTKEKVKKAIFYLDAPVSNSGKLKTKIIGELKNYNLDLDVIITNQVDSTLEKLDNVITSDSIILDRCISWYNLNKRIIFGDGVFA